VQAVAATQAKILDTRKTTPGLRALEKHAVRCGGGVNHRMGLYDAVLLKENHLALVPEKDFADLVARARKENPDLPVIVEADGVALAVQLLGLEPDRILLDNLSPPDVAQVVMEKRRIGSSIPLEVSGGVTVERAREYAQAGADFISVGSLTHSARAIDFALDWKK
jgi:nicotinate-nucleotide pyrophosphorylase (carboxylating)